MEDNILDFVAPIKDTTKNIIKVVGVGGGGCNAVNNMYRNPIHDVTFAVCNTDSQSLSKSPVPVKMLLGSTGHGAGADPVKGKSEAEQNVDDIRKLLSDGTRMVFVTAGMGGGTGTGAAPVVAGVAKSMGLLTVGIVTIPFYFEKRRKIIKALKGVEEMRKNVDALLIINNERLCDVYNDTEIPIKEAFKRADDILGSAARSISELITVDGEMNLDFCDVETTMRGGGGAIMAMGRANGSQRVQNAILDALNSPLLYGRDISKAKRILFSIYTGDEKPLLVNEMSEIDAFMESLDPNIDVIWGLSNDNTIGEDAKVTILATGLGGDWMEEMERQEGMTDNDFYDDLIRKLYRRKKHAAPVAAALPEECETALATDADEEDADTPLADDGQLEQTQADDSREEADDSRDEADDSREEADDSQDEMDDDGRQAPEGESPQKMFLKKVVDRIRKVLLETTHE